MRVIECGGVWLDVSVVVPVMDEVGSVSALAGEVSVALGGTGWAWECIWVDDGSSDGTGPSLDRIAACDGRHRVLHLDGNFGQSAALAAGLSAAGGAVAVTMDGDGQSDPSDIPGLVRRLFEDDLDVVNGVRMDRRDTWIRRLASRIGNGFRNRVTGEAIRDVGCSLRAARRECYEGLLVFRGMHRFQPSLIRLNGYDRMVEVPVSHRPRLHGRPKYGIRNRLWVGFADTLAVAWMQRRLVSPRVVPGGPATGGRGDVASVARARAGRAGGVFREVPGPVAGERTSGP